MSAVGPRIRAEVRRMILQDLWRFIAVREYWTRVLVRAFHDTLTTIGSNTRKFIFGAIFTIIAAGLLLYFNDANQAFQKIEWWIFIGIAYIVVFPLVFSWLLLRTPFVLERDLLQRLNDAQAVAEKLRGGSQGTLGSSHQQEKYVLLLAQSDTE